MHTLLLIVALGWASQYSPGVMNKVIVNQQYYDHLPANLPEVDGYIAVQDCHEIGNILYIRPENGRWEKFLVTDCAGDDITRAWMSRNRILVEVDYETAARWNSVGRGKRIEISKENHAKTRLRHLPL